MARYDDELDDTDESSPRDLRRQLDKEKQARKDLEARLTAYEERDRQRTVADTFAQYGVDPRFAKLAQVEVEDISEDSLRSWIEANADLVGVRVAPPSEEQHQLPPREDPYRRMAAVNQVGLPPVALDPVSQVESMSPEELIASMGGGR